MGQWGLYEPQPPQQSQGFILVIEIPGIESERVTRRIDFLRSRAFAHLELEPEATHSKACAATLLRDSACLSLLTGRTREACVDLMSAGKEFLNLGLVEGATLVALADTVKAQEVLESFSDVIEGVRHQEYQRTYFETDEQRSSSEAGEQRRRMTNVGLGAAYDVLSLLQADLLLVKNNAQELPPFAGPMEEVLEYNGGYAVSATGLSFETYVGVARSMVKDSRVGVSYSSELAVAWLRTLYAVRAENVRSGMKDTYNWGMLLKPAELVDLDSVVLMCLAVGDGHLERELDEFLAEESSLCQAPLIVARELMRS